MQNAKSVWGNERRLNIPFFNSGCPSHSGPAWLVSPFRLVLWGRAGTESSTHSRSLIYHIQPARIKEKAVGLQNTGAAAAYSSQRATALTLRRYCIHPYSENQARTITISSRRTFLYFRIFSATHIQSGDQERPSILSMVWTNQLLGSVGHWHWMRVCQ